MEKTNAVLVFLIIIVFVLASQKTNEIVPQDDTEDDTDYSSLVKPKVSFNGQNFFKTGTTIDTEYVKVVRDNGDERKDLGNFRLDGSTMETTPNYNYKFYFFMNNSKPSDTYYVDTQEYTSPIMEAIDPQVGSGCQMDSSPTFAAYDEHGNIQTTSANAQSMGASQTKTVTILVKSHSYKCYGTPNAPKDNAICIIYDSNNFTGVETNTGYMSVPKTVMESTAATTSFTSIGIVCAKLPVLQNLEEKKIFVTLTSGSKDPTSNLTVVSDDIAFDLNRNTLEEIWGYTDEDGNSLGVNATELGAIRIS